jgi:hypothetical protein
METTQSKPPRLPLILCGLVLSMGAFLFGGFMALPALLFVIPKLRRYWLLGAALFVGVVAVRGLTLVGVNPVLSFARDKAVERLEEALGGEVSYAEFNGDATLGELNFTELRVTLPEIGGEVSLESVRVDAGWFLIHRPDGYVITGRGLIARVDASGGKLGKFLADRDTPGEAASIAIEGGSVEVYGSPTTATLELASLSASSGKDGWELKTALKHAALTVIGQTHELNIYGGFAVGERGDGLWVAADLKAEDAEAGFGILRGRLEPGGGALVCTIDQLNFKPLWARYRKVDTYDGVARGNIRVTGTLGELVLDIDGEVSDFSYYHFTAMGLNPEDSFKLPLGWLSGRVVMTDGEFVDFEDVKVQADVATLATGPNMSASGSGTLVLNGRLPKLTGRLQAVVESGTISQQISWGPAPLNARKLADVQPNIIVVAEQFANLSLDWQVEVKALQVDCEPLTGMLTGTLSGTLAKEEGVRVSTLRATGELSMVDGKVKCLGVDGDLTGRVVFNPNAPTYHASVRGTITAKLGETPIDCELTGDIKRPGFIFKGANMGLEELGKKIYRQGASTPAELIARREQCTQIFGASAAAAENPFMAMNAGGVFFSVR